MNKPTFSARLVRLLLYPLMVLSGIMTPSVHATTFSLNQSTFSTNDDITASWTRDSGDSLSAKDWIGIYKQSQVPSASSASLRWLYLDGTKTAPTAAIKSGCATFAAPALAAGDYVARFFPDGGYTSLADVPFTVISAGSSAVPVFVISDFPLRHAVVGKDYTGCIHGYAKDADVGDVLSFTKLSGPAWLSVAANGTLSGSPGPGDVGTGSFSVRATDPENHSCTASFTIHVFSPGTEQIDNLRVLSYNLFHGWGKFANGPRKGLDSIILSGADIVCTVETTDNVAGSGLFQAETIARELGWYFTRIPGGGDLGVVSRYPIVATYPVTTAVGARIQVCASPLQEVIAYSCHIDHQHYGPYEAARAGSTNDSTLAEELASSRYEQSAALITALQAHLAAADQTPLLVCGDFNCPSHQDWTAATAVRHHGKIINWPVTLALTNAGLVDTYRQLHPDPLADPGNTWSPIYSGNEPLDRIDFIFAKGRRLKAAASSVFTTNVEVTVPNYYSALAPTINNTWPSDHAAVLTDFRLIQPGLGGE